jgi:Cu-Zn family superoxide dismutase
MKKLIATAAVAMLAACQSIPDEPLRATAALQPTKGSKAFGEATFEQAGDKVRVIVFTQGLKPNAEHGLHIQQAGDCNSGGGGGAKLPALKAGKDGRAKVDATLDAISIGQGPGNVLGRSLIIDDSGARVACGVIKAG